MQFSVALGHQLRTLVESKLEKFYFIDNYALSLWHHVADGISFSCTSLILCAWKLGLCRVACHMPHLIARSLHHIDKRVIACDERSPSEEHSFCFLKVVQVKNYDWKNVISHRISALARGSSRLIERTAYIADCLCYSRVLWSFHWSNILETFGHLNQILTGFVLGPNLCAHWRN